MSKNVPKLRFKGFEDEWKKEVLGDLIVEKVEKTEDKSKYPLYSLTIESGVVPKSDRYEREFLVKKEGNFKIVNNNDFVYNPMNLRFGALASYKGDFPVSVSGYYNIFSFKNKGLEKFWDNYLKTARMMYLYNTIATSSLEEKKRVHYSQFKELKLPIPSLQEQEKIANFLSKVDSIIEKQEKKVEYWNSYKKGMMQKIFSQKIRFKDENGRDYPEWEEKKMKDISIINQGLQISISERFTEPKKGRYFYITNEFLKANSDKKYYIENPPKSVICTEEDILMTRTGNTGKVVTDVAGAFHNNFFKVNYKKENIVKKFIYYFLISDKIQKVITRLAGSSTIPDLNHTDFYNIKIQVPCLEEQRKISNFLSNIDNIVEKENKKLEELRQWKKGLLQQMFV